MMLKRGEGKKERREEERREKENGRGGGRGREEREKGGERRKEREERGGKGREERGKKEKEKEEKKRERERGREERGGREEGEREKGGEREKEEREERERGREEGERREKERRKRERGREERGGKFFYYFNDSVGNRRRVRLDGPISHVSSAAPAGMSLRSSKSGIETLFRIFAWGLSDRAVSSAEHTESFSSSLPIPSSSFPSSSSTTHPSRQLEDGLGSADRKVDASCVCSHVESRSSSISSCASCAAGISTTCSRSNTTCHAPGRLPVFPLRWNPSVIRFNRAWSVLLGFSQFFTMLIMEWLEQETSLSHSIGRSASGMHFKSSRRSVFAPPPENGHSDGAIGSLTTLWLLTKKTRWVFFEEPIQRSQV
jgi:hypothetical protein